MNAGELKHRIYIKYLDGETSQNEAGEDITGYKLYKSVRAKVTPVSGKEEVEAQKNINKLDYKIKIRYQSGVNENMIVIFKNKVLKIRSVINVDELNREMELMCQYEVGADGNS